MRNIRAEHHSQYLKSKRNKDALPEKSLEKTPIFVTPVTQEDNLPSNDTSNKWAEGTISIEGNSILNGTDASLLSQKRLVKVRQFPGTTITDMNDHLKIHQCKFENLLTFSSLHKNNIQKVSQYNTFYFLRNAHPRYVKCLFTHLRKQ